MTVSTQSSQTQVAGSGAQTVFNFRFVTPDEQSVSVIYMDSDGNQTLLEPSQYTVNLNAVAVGQLWPVGGTVTYPLTGPAIATGTYLIISRTVSLTQETTIRNQGNFYAEVTERAIDLQCMEGQQVSARTGQQRGTWAGGVFYNFGDTVQDGSNGDDTLNYYTCVVANTSSTWASDLAAGYWSLTINIQQTEQFANDAAASASAALVSQNAAAASASAALISANNAASSESVVASDAAAAQLAAANAMTAQAAAETAQASAEDAADSSATSASTASSAAITANAASSSASSSASAAATSASDAASSAVSAASSAQQAAGSLLGTSTSSVTIGTGTKNFTTQSGLALGVGGFITVASTVSPANYMHGQVDSYSGTSLVVNVLDTGGAGTLASWTITTSSPQGPAGAGAGTVASGTINQLTYYAATGDTASGNANATISNGDLTLGQAGSVGGSLVLSKAAGLTTTLVPASVGGGTQTMPNGTGTLMSKSSIDTCTNKTIAASSNVLGGVTMTLGSDATGDVYYRNASGVLTRLALGGANTVLHGGTTAPAFSAVVEADMTLTDVTTNNVTSTKHGFAPKSSADATLFLNGAAAPAYAAVKDSDLSTTDVTTNNVSSTKHGFAPKSPANETFFLNGASTPAFAAVMDSDLSTSDITTNNATASKHGFLPKLSGSATEFLDGTGAWSTPTGGSTTAGAVSSYMMARKLTGDIAFGGTTAGSNLDPAGYDVTTDTWVFDSSTSISGTWRCMGYATGSGVADDIITLWVRTV